MCSSRSRSNARNRLPWRGVVLTRDWGRYCNIVAVSVGRIVLDHPVGCRLPQTLGIFVYDRLLVIEGLCVVDKTLAIAFDLGEARVTSSGEFVLRHSKSVSVSKSSSRSQQAENLAAVRVLQAVWCGVAWCDMVRRSSAAQSSAVQLGSDMRR